MTMQLKTSRSVVVIDAPQEVRFLCTSPTPGSITVYLARLQDTPGARGLGGEAHIDAQAHILTVWAGPSAVGQIMLDALNDALDVGDGLADVAELERIILENRDAPPNEHDDTDLTAYATEIRALSTSLREAIETVAADLATYSASVPITTHAKTLREVAAYAADGYEVIAKALDDIANP